MTVLAFAGGVLLILFAGFHLFTTFSLSEGLETGSSDEGTTMVALVPEGIARLPIASVVAEVFGFTASITIARVMVGICWRETSGKTTPPVVGDTGTTKGPSIGPLQVLRQTAIDYGLVPRDETAETYRARAMDELWCLRAGCKVFLRKLSDARGDIYDAVKRYNGSGPAAEAYRDAVFSWLAVTYGENWQSN